jgi:drug/metabolite transporter (DMT)-like permease
MSTLHARPREDSPLAGILLMVTAYLCFTGLDTCAKYLGQTLSPFEIAFVRYCGHLLIVSGAFLPVYRMSMLRTNAPFGQFRRSIALLGATILAFAALQTLPLAAYSAIAFTSPLLVAALSMPLLGERVGPRRWAAIGVGFLGMLIVVRPGVAEIGLGALLAFLCAVSGALYSIETRRLAGVDPTLTQQFYPALLATFATLPLAIPVWRWPADGITWAAFAAIAVFGFAGHYCLTSAYRLAPPAMLAPFAYSQIVSMTLSGYLVFGEVPDAWVLLGASIVVAAGLYVWFRERQLARRS